MAIVFLLEKSNVKVHSFFIFSSRKIIISSMFSTTNNDFLFECDIKKMKGELIDY